MTTKPPLTGTPISRETTADVARRMARRMTEERKKHGSMSVLFVVFGALEESFNAVADEAEAEAIGAQKRGPS